MVSDTLVLAIEGWQWLQRVGMVFNRRWEKRVMPVQIHGNLAKSNAQMFLLIFDREISKNI